MFGFPGTGVSVASNTDTVATTKARCCDAGSSLCAVANRGLSKKRETQNTIVSMVTEKMRNIFMILLSIASIYQKEFSVEVVTVDTLLLDVW